MFAKKAYERDKHLLWVITHKSICGRNSEQSSDSEKEIFFPLIHKPRFFFFNLKTSYSILHSFSYWSFKGHLRKSICHNTCKYFEKTQKYFQIRASQMAYSKESACNAGDTGSIPRLGRSSGEGNGNPFQYSCLGNPMDRAACGLQSMW